VIALNFTHCLFAQTKSFSVSLAPFSTLTNDEFSPVYYKNGIVFCSTLKNNSLITYKKDQKKLINIFFAAKKDNKHWSDAVLLTDELTTNFNEGPATFNDSANLIYYCRNNNITHLLKDMADGTNKLGIYSAEFVNGNWTNIRTFTFNNPAYSFVTPALTPDGKRLYFASDMPGGFGGVDLYYCDWKGNDWDKPVNLGPEINTPQNESYPFACKSGKLFFSSDGLPGFGGKDIFYSRQINGKWITPIHLDAEINSPFDDFGIVTDENFENGFFSSNRRKTDDIFYFTADLIQFAQCDSMVKNTYCFLFYDDHLMNTDTIPVTYLWDFGNGIIKTGQEVAYCFPGPGNYEVILNIADSLQTNSILGKTSYKFELKEFNQAFINSPDAGIAGKELSFDGYKSNLPGFNISGFLWDFGEGFKIRGPSVNKVFDKNGEYTVRLGLLGEKDNAGNIAKACVFKKIKIFDDYQALAAQTAKEINWFKKFYNFEIQNNSDIQPCKPKNIVRENNGTEPSDSLKIRIYLLDNLSESQKKNIVKTLYKTRDCIIKINDKEIDTESYPILINFIEVLKEDSNLRLEIATHTEGKVFSGNSIKITEKWARDLYSYFSNNGISDERVHCKGFGESRPNTTEYTRDYENLNQRIEFIFMNNPNQKL
jgi:outer membrane protein OmpA-like peptidoglycan-associated protein